MKTNFFLTALMVLVIAVAGIIAFGGPSKAGEKPDYEAIVADGCVTLEEATEMSLYDFPDAVVAYSDEHTAIFSSPTAPDDLVLFFDEEGCAYAFQEQEKTGA